MKKIIIIILLTVALLNRSGEMKTIPYTDSNIKYSGRFLDTVGYKQTAWQGSQIRFKVKQTTQVIITADISDISSDSLCFLGVSIDNSPDVTVYSLSTSGEIYTGERNVTIPIADSGEHLITIKTSANMPLDQYSTTSYIRFKNIQIDNTGEILPYLQPDKLIMCIGDSWMGAQNDFPRLMENYNIYPVAFGGAKASDIDAMYPYQASGVNKKDTKVDGVIILLGVNDYAGGVSTSSYKSSVLSIVDKVKADQTAPIFLIQAPRNVGASMNYDQYGTVLSEISNEIEGVMYIPTNEIWHELTWLETYHLDGAGKRLFANYISLQLDSYYVKKISLNYFLNGEITSIDLKTVGDVKIFVDGEHYYLDTVGINDSKASAIRVNTSEEIMAIAI